MNLAGKGELIAFQGIAKFAEVGLISALLYGAGDLTNQLAAGYFLSLGVEQAAERKQIGESHEIIRLSLLDQLSQAVRRNVFFGYHVCFLKMLLMPD